MAELRWYGNKAVSRAMQAAIQAIQTCAADLQGKSAMQAPIDTGDLRANCSVSPLQREGNQVWVKVGYDLPYSIVQHERLDFNHPKGGKAKYLEDPFNDNARKYERYIANEVGKALERG
ncbi:hypothetical protein SAMN00808754_1942 [Thermanaeromonas toyohensis ToBE]|uniref:Uncharacterized protein n=1 Tax=Thermanaeromonas toyohensis ToBE TaxID=698762 RepID=A0A1W1VWZ8_9FIRM|nr:hypothetical protein [Thermanaeromonas toyohensis]SMB97780.1 hypothetical protein SAMN00808754_1942 [Thermanaeromonas toyohensis ToBE]